MTESEVRAGLDKNPDDVAAMFDHVAPRYDLMNDLLSVGQVHIWRKATINAIDPYWGQRVLDLAAGTGTSSAAIAKQGATVVACDLSSGMIEVGQERHPDIEFVLGNAEDLPFEDDSFDAVTISFGIRNVQNVPKALAEMLRVTKQGGRLVICEFSSPDNHLFRSAYEFYTENVLPKVAKVASTDSSAYEYLTESIVEWPDKEEFGDIIAASGWDDVEYRALSGGIVALHRAYKN